MHHSFSKRKLIMSTIPSYFKTISDKLILLLKQTNNLHNNASPSTESISYSIPSVIPSFSSDFTVSYSFICGTVVVLQIIR